MYYLYIKTHKITGLKYLGYTSQDPFVYRGSGIYWVKHIRKHGKNITTDILLETNHKDEIKKAGLYYSELWNIVESKAWANLKPEEGDGGSHIHTEETRYKSGWSRGKKRPDQAAFMKGNTFSKGRPSKFKGVCMTEEEKEKLRGPRPHRCKPVIINGITYNGNTEAAKALGISVSGLYRKYLNVGKCR